MHYSARTGKYLEAPAGSPSRHLLALARQGLRLDLRTALEEAVETRRRSSASGVMLELDDRVQAVELTVEPLSEDGAEPLFLVLFTDVGPPLAAGEAVRAGARAVRRARSRSRSASCATRASACSRPSRSTRPPLEELKSANEELISINEEMQSTNEELETSKEEIQSINEELHTVNQELSIKVDQLNQANDDLAQPVREHAIALVFLDRDLVIRSFTPAATEIFSLIADRPRPPAHRHHDATSTRRPGRRHPARAAPTASRSSGASRAATAARTT